MINLAVINLKNLIKNIIKIIIVTLVVTMIFKFVEVIKNANITEKLKTRFSNLEINIISGCASIFNQNNKIEFKSEKILEEEFEVFYNDEYVEKTLQENLQIGNIQENINIEKLNDIKIENEPEKNLRNLNTKIVDVNNKKDTYTNIYGNVKIKNESEYTLTESMLSPNIKFENNKNILIFHTHTCESYTPTSQNNYIASGNFRTTDLNYSVARVGNELADCLSKKGYNVYHDVTYHDYPAYNGSYTRSLKTIKNILNNNMSAELVIDLHRDALGSNSSYGPTVMIGEEQVAQLMFVIGTNGGGLSHDNWNNNLKFAVLIQAKAEEMYPGLFKPIIVRNSRYNQNMADGACIIEVGATGNTLEQANASMKYLAEVISEVMK